MLEQEQKNNTFGEKLEITSVIELAWAKREKSREAMNVKEKVRY